MKSRIRLFSILSLMVVLLVATGCNADASSGLFWQLANSREVLDVRYSQLLGQDSTTDNLFFLTDTGMYATAGETTSTSVVVANSKDNLIQSAYFDDSNYQLLYTINSAPTKVQKHTIGAGTVTLDPNLAGTTITSLLRLKVLPNGLVMLTGTNAGGDTTYALVEDDLAAVVSNLETQSLDGYGLVGVLQKTGYAVNSIAGEPLIASFVNEDEEYKHFYIPIGNVAAIQINVNNSYRIVNFFESGTNLYLLTSDGRIFKGSSTDPSQSFTQLVDVTETYTDQAFGYVMTSAPNIFYITKPNNKDQLTVFTIDSITDAVTTTAITKGYAKYIYNTEIADALELSVGTLLVATARNGMYKVTITTPNNNDETNGTSSEAEKYFP